MIHEVSNQESTQEPVMKRVLEDIEERHRFSTEAMDEGTFEFSFEIVGDNQCNGNSSKKRSKFRSGKSKRIEHTVEHRICAVPVRCRRFEGEDTPANAQLTALRTQQRTLYANQPANPNP